MCVSSATCIHPGLHMCRGVLCLLIHILTVEAYPGHHHTCHLSTFIFLTWSFVIVRVVGTVMITTTVGIPMQQVMHVHAACGNTIMCSSVLADQMVTRYYT